MSNFIFEASGNSQKFVFLPTHCLKTVLNQIWKMPPFNSFSHGVGHIGHALLWRQIAKQNFNDKNFEKIMYSSEIILWIFLLRRCPFKKSIYVCFLRPKTSSPKGRSNRPALVRAWPYSFLHLKSYPLKAPTKMNLPYPLPTTAGGGDPLIVQKSAWP